VKINLLWGEFALGRICSGEESCSGECQLLSCSAQLLWGGNFALGRKVARGCQLLGRNVALGNVSCSVALLSCSGGGNFALGRKVALGKCQLLWGGCSGEAKIARGSYSGELLGGEKLLGGVCQLLWGEKLKVALGRICSGEVNENEGKSKIARGSVSVALGRKVESCSGENLLGGSK